MIEGPYRVPDTLTWQERVFILGRLAMVGTNAPSVQALATRAYAEAIRAHEQTFSQQRRLAIAALGVVQKVGYHPDPPNEEWFQPVGWTAVHGGDCEDLATLLVSVCTLLGLMAKVIWIEQPGRVLNHVSTMILVDGRPFWADPSIAGARFGENPYDAIARMNKWSIIGARKVR